MNQDQIVQLHHYYCRKGIGTDGKWWVVKIDTSAIKNRFDTLEEAIESLVNYEHSSMVQ